MLRRGKQQILVSQSRWKQYKAALFQIESAGSRAPQPSSEGILWLVKGFNLEPLTGLSGVFFVCSSCFFKPSYRPENSSPMLHLHGLFIWVFGLTQTLLLSVSISALTIFGFEFSFVSGLRKVIQGPALPSHRSVYVYSNGHWSCSSQVHSILYFCVGCKPIIWEWTGWIAEPNVFMVGL